MIFRIIMAVSYILVTLMRLYFYLSAQQIRGQFTYRESGLPTIAKSALAVLGTIILLGDAINPAWLAWFTLSFDTWLKWIGASMGVGGALLLFWTHRTLGANFSPFLHLRQQHTLVMSGPYAWVRHPMYTGFFLNIMAWFLLSANWLIALVWLAFGVIVTLQINAEEALLVEKFGHQYRQYMKSTGQFLPRRFW
jgi:protein-S-isoprenylcysteine O-methyltransferase Ste14